MAKTTKPDEIKQAAQCIGKHRYESVTLARSIAKRSRGSEESRVSVYRCQTCNGWHIGNRRPMKFRKEGKA
jgi:hypothetical protein